MVSVDIDAFIDSADASEDSDINPSSLSKKQNDRNCIYQDIINKYEQNDSESCD